LGRGIVAALAHIFKPSNRFVYLFDDDAEFRDEPPVDIPNVSNTNLVSPTVWTSYESSRVAGFSQWSCNGPSYRQKADLKVGTTTARSRSVDL
jgi:hypothetical protein